MTVAERRPRIMEVIERYGRCLELVPIDPHFHDISVALYEKDGTATVWTFSRREGVEGRIRQIRDQLAALGYMDPIDGTYNQLRPPCGVIHYRPLKFLMMQAVEKDPSFTHADGPVKDLRSDMMLSFESTDVDGRTVYRVRGEGEARNPAGRLRAITSGFSVGGYSLDILARDRDSCDTGRWCGRRTAEWPSAAGRGTIS